MLGYKPRWHIAECMRKPVEFSRKYIMERESLPEEMDNEIDTFFINRDSYI